MQRNLKLSLLKLSTVYLKFLYLVLWIALPPIILVCLRYFQSNLHIITISLCSSIIVCSVGFLELRCTLYTLAGAGLLGFKGFHRMAFSKHLAVEIMPFYPTHMYLYWWILPLARTYNCACYHIILQNPC